MLIHLLRPLVRAFAVLLITLLPAALSAQVAPAAAGGPPYAAWAIFGGYSLLVPHTIVTGQVMTPDDCKGSRHSLVTLAADGLWNCPVGMEAMLHGSDESLTREFSGRLGVQLDAAQHDVYYNDPRSLESNSGIWTIQAGPVFRFERRIWTPWLHLLAGGGEMHGPDHQNYTPGFTATGGGGLDIATPWLHHHLSVRILEADYEYMRVRYGSAHPSSDGWQAGGVANMVKSIRFATGLVLHIR